MKKVIMSITEFYLFKDIATFMYEYAVTCGKVAVNANTNDLKSLGW